MVKTIKNMMVKASRVSGMLLLWLLFCCQHVSIALATGQPIEHPKSEAFVCDSLLPVCVKFYRTYLYSKSLSRIVVQSAETGYTEVFGADIVGNSYLQDNDPIDTTLGCGYTCTFQRYSDYVFENRGSIERCILANLNDTTWKPSYAFRKYWTPNELVSDLRRGDVYWDYDLFLLVLCYIRNQRDTNCLNAADSLALLRQSYPNRHLKGKR